MKTKTHFDNPDIMMVNRLPLTSHFNVTSSEVMTDEMTTVTRCSEGAWEAVNSEEHKATLYKKTFNWTEPLTDDVYLLSIPGSGFNMDVFVNSVFIGYDHGLHSDYFFDISAVLEEGDNTLLFRCYEKEPYEPEVENEEQQLQNMLQNIEIHKKPKISIYDMGLSTVRLEEDNFWRLEAKLKVRNVLSQRIPLKIKLYLSDDNNNDALCIGHFVAEETGVFNSMVAATVEDPKLWSAWEPNLYTVTIVVTDHLDHEIETVSMPVGFCCVETNDLGWHINGFETDVKGVHFSLPEDGLEQSVKEAYYKDHLKMLKNLNINTLLVEGWVVDEYFYNLCDSYGFYVLNQLPYTFNKHRYTSHLDNVEMMAVKLRNHVCQMGYIIGDGLFVVKTASHREFYFNMKRQLLEGNRKALFFDGVPGVSLTIDSLEDTLIAMESKCRNQPLWFEWDGESSIITCHANEWLPLEAFEFYLEYYEDGELIQTESGMKAATKDIGIYEVESKLLNTANNDKIEQWIVIALRIKTSTWWASKDSVVAFEQYEFGTLMSEPVSISSQSSPKIYEKDNHLVVSAHNCTYRINLKNSQMTELECMETNLLSAPIAAYIDEQLRIKALEYDIVENVTVISATANDPFKSGDVTYQYIIGDDDAFTIRIEGSESVIRNEAAITMGLRFKPNDVSYYGYGPHDNRIGHHSFALMKVHSEDKLEGTRTGIRWLSLVDDNGWGIMIESAKTVPLSVAAEKSEEGMMLSVMGDFEEIESEDSENSTLVLEYKVTLINDDI